MKQKNNYKYPEQQKMASRQCLVIAFMCLFVMFQTALWAEDRDISTADYQFNHIAVQDGLIDNEIIDVIQDRAGFIWLATPQGLILYDGDQFKSFHHNVNIETSLSSNRINVIFEDNQGILWVGTERGLNQQIEHEFKFKRYLNDPNQNTSLADNKIVDISQDSAGRLWIASQSAVHVLNNNESFRRYFFYDTGNGQNAEISHLVSTDGKLFVVTSSGLFHYLDNEQRFSRLSTDDGLPSDDYKITAITDEYQDQIWIAVANHGLYRFNNETLRFEPLKELAQFHRFSEISSDITAILTSTVDRELWIGTQNNGLYKYQLDKQQLTKIVQTNVNEFNAFDNSGILGLLQDSSGLVWVNTLDAGLFLWSRHTLGIEHFGFHSGFRDVNLLRSYIWFFHQTDEQAVWVGTQRGLMKFNPQTKDYHVVETVRSEQGKNPAIYWIESEQDTLWMATSNGLIHYDFINDQVIGHYLQDIENSVYSLHIHNGLIYVAVDELGIIVFDRQTMKPVNHSISIDGVHAELFSSPLALIEDQDQSIWILTRNGLFNYDSDTNRIRIELRAGPDQLSGERISALFQQGNNYWIGTTGNGINLLTVNDFETSDYVINQFENNSVLANLVVNGILLDQQQPAGVWISTHSGLLYYDPENDYSRTFKLEEGMQGLEFNEAAHYIDTTGMLYFGGINGFNRINPRQFNRSEYQPVVRITDISLNCKTDDTDCSDVEETFKKQIYCDNSVEFCETSRNLLPSDVQAMTIEFAALDYTLPENNVYQYRLNKSGLSEWVSLGNRNQLTLTGLSSGRYVLEIQGSNFVGEWSPQIAQLAFRVDAPWYYQDYTLIILFLTIVTSIYYFSESRKLRQLESQRIETAIRTNEENFKFALWGSGDEMWDWKILDKSISRTNPIQLIDIDKNSEQLTIDDVLGKIHNEDSNRVRAEMIDMLKGEQPFMESIFRIKSRGSDYLWVMCRARVVERDDNSRALRALGSLKDITLMKATEDKLTLIAQAFENTKEGISVVDANFKPIFNNKSFYEITGLDQLESINKQYFFAEDSENHSLFNQVKVYLQNFGEWEGELWEKRGNGEEFAMSLKIDSVNDPNSDKQSYICVFSDITYKKRSEEELIRLANIDALTGLPNRSLFLDRLSHAIAYSRRNSSMFALLFIDLDNFKNINDTLGHSFGDKMLINISKRLKSCVRDVDTVARLGGDEFTVILENIKNTNEVGVCANKILARLSEAMEIDGSLLKTTPSIGIGMFPTHGQDRESILKNADLAMYSAKEKGKNNYQFFTEDMTSLAMERINIEHKLREAIDSHQLSLFYQPKVYTVTGEVTGFEALIRWIHPEDGIISPGAFIPVAEETGLILSLGDWIIEEAIRQAKAWSEIAPNHCQIAINISAKQFMSDSLPDRILELLNKYELDPKFIELEITEGTLMDNMHFTIESLNRLREMGLEISLDDFGTGYSSLSYLKRFPVNQLKIDQSFIRDISRDPSDASIVASIITLAHNLGLNVVAEGCETVEQLKFLRSYHCEQVQGYLFSRPLPKEEAEKILLAGRIDVDDDV